MCNIYYIMSIKKTNVLEQDISKTPTIRIGDFLLKSVHKLTYLSCTISSKISFNTELNKGIWKVASTLVLLSTLVWVNCMLTILSKMKVCQAFVMSTLLFYSNTWTLCSLRAQT